MLVCPGDGPRSNAGRQKTYYDSNQKVVVEVMLVYYQHQRRCVAGLIKKPRTNEGRLHDSGATPNTTIDCGATLDDVSSQLFYACSIILY